MKPIHIGDVVGDYRVIANAGSGGMGDVYKIEHVITKRIEAMKLLPPAASSDPELVQRFEREIQVQARLHHPNIVALYNAVRAGDTIALVMEFVEGESLQHKLEAGPLPVQIAADYTAQVLRALAYAHEAGVIHRDVAPANILITPDGVAKLMDFGLARATSDLRLSTSGVPVGSPWYMSPEQVIAIGPMDARTDIYATGAVLYEMLTGAKLFNAEGAFAVMRAQVEAAPERPGARNPKISAALDEVVLRAVEKHPAMRFQSADEFRLALQKAVGSIRPAILPLKPCRNWRAPAFGLSPRLREFLPSRAAVAVAMLPIALMAGLLRLVPVAARVDSPAVKPVALVAQQDPAPAPPLIAAEPVAPVLTPEPPAPAPVAALTQAAEPPVISRPRVRVPVQSVRRPAKPESYAIRVTGGDVEPAPVLAVASPSHHQSLDPPEPPVTEAAALPEPPPVIESSADPAAAPAKPAAAGNRLVRALGKVNPFRRGAARSQFKKD